MFAHSRVRRTLLAAALLLATMAAWGMARAETEPLTPVTLQLKWRHQFQFAGFYAAVDKGYYARAGLDVTLLEWRPGMRAIEEVMEDRAQFGLGTSELLLQYLRGQPVVVLGAVFQHDPNILICSPSGIHSPSDLRGKRVRLYKPYAASILAMLRSQGLSPNDLDLAEHATLKDFRAGRIDAIAAYLTDQPFTLRREGVSYTVMRPRAFGVDLYGDCLFTSAAFARQHPDITERFAQASFQGWDYAMAHPEEIIDLIVTHYPYSADREALRSEAAVMRELVLPELIPTGAMNPARWERIAAIYEKLGMIDGHPSIKGFLFVPARKKRLETLMSYAPHIAGLAALGLVAVLALVLFNRRLKRGIRARTRDLEESRTILRQVIDLSPNLVHVLDKDGTILLANRAMAESMNRHPDKMAGQSYATVQTDTLQADKTLDEVRQVLDTGMPISSLEEPYRFADGSTHWIQTTRLPFPGTGSKGPAVLSMGMDITHRREADEAIKASEARFRAVFDQTYQLTCILDLDGVLIQANATTLAAFALDEVTLAGTPLTQAPWWRAEQVEDIKADLKTARRGATVRRRTTITRADGTAMDMDFTLKPARDRQGNLLFLIAEAHDITSLMQSEAALRDLNRDLEKRVADRTRNLAQAKADLVASLEQLQQTQEELIMAEKLAGLGGLVAGVAHEINTPLGVGVTASSFLAGKVAALREAFETGSLKKSDLEKFIATAEESAATILANLERGAELVKSFKQVAADQSSEMARRFNVREYMDEILLSLRPKYKHTDHVILNDCPDVEIYSLPGAIMHIVTNLLLNALDHAYDDGEAGHIVLGGEVEGADLVLTFTDDGKGIPADLTDKVFEPFFTTRRGKGGTGLGLHIVHNTVTKALGGTLRMESASGKGTRFIITIPMQQENARD